LEGNVAPDGKVKLRVLGVAEMEDTPPPEPVEITFKVTGMVMTPLALPTVTNPPYVPTAKPPGFTETITASGVVPLAVLTLSQEPGKTEVVTTC